MKMKYSANRFLPRLFAAGIAVVLLFLAFFIPRVSAETQLQGRLVTVYDRGQETRFMTHAATLKEALDAVGITVDSRDVVEPSLSEELVASDYRVNIYRARPVTVVDGQTRQRVITAYQSAERIAADAGISLQQEDIAQLTRSEDVVVDGAGLQLLIDRALPVTLDMYGSIFSVRTQAETVTELLSEKNIVLDAAGRSEPAGDQPIVAGMTIRVWQEGIQTLTVDEPVTFETQQIKDADRPIGYKEVVEQGEAGSRSVTYEIEIKDGVTVSRKEIASLTLRAPKTQVEIVGIKNTGTGLTKSMGVKMFTDSKGVVHRETYYDLNMAVVMRYCGQTEYYVREDGVKVDAQGYILVAANLARYPRCSLVETSLGTGKVYDTGGFAAVHPDGFDLATDWTVADGI